MLFMALLLIPVLLFGFIQTPPGKALLARGLSAGLSSHELTVRIGRITGWIPGKVTVEEVAVGDAEGLWISGKSLHCRWMMRELLNERIRLQALSAEEIVWHRLPKRTKKAAAEPRTPGDGFELLEVRLDGLRIDSFRLEKGVARVPLEYAVHSGGITYLTTGHLDGELTLSGDAVGVVHLEAALAGRKTDQLKITADLQEMVNPTFGMDELSGQGEAVINADGISAVLMLDLVHAGQPGGLSTRLRFQNRMLNLQHLQYTSPDHRLLGDAALTFKEGAVGVALDAAFVDVRDHRYDVRGTAEVVRGRQWAVELESLEIKARESISLHLAGEINAQEVNLSGELAEMDFGQLPFGGSSRFSGRVNGSVSVTGPLEQPAVDALVTVQGLASRQSMLDELPPLDFRVQGGIADGRLYGATSITNYAKGHFAADFSMPCGFSLLPLRYKPVPRETDAQLRADLDLDLLNQLELFRYQLIRGQLRAALSYAGGRPSGYLRVEDGRYEHFDLGVVVRAFNADLEAVDDGFKIVKGSASGSGEGTVAFGGGFSRSGLAIDLGFSHAWLLQRDEIEAKVSGGLLISGPLRRPLISGDLTVDRADLMLDNIVRPPPPVLTNYERAAADDPAVVQAADKTPAVGLDIRLSLPDQVFVNASMIEAVLGGSLRITDTARGVSVRGEIEPRRGFVSFIGKKFRFTEGKIVLDGSVPPAAALDSLTAEYTRGDVTASLVLNGPVNDPRFQLESTPSMPEDEILSYVLFDRDTSSISPWQAVQIASAARQLTGGLNGPGFMYQVRQAIGVDTLEWREAEAAGEASSVAAGKYLTSGLYVELNQTLDAQSELGFTAELEVTPHFSVETYTGPQLRPGIGLNWRNDY